jgi:TRAP-type C4-dicarboxylate transport system substrate-binding protein
MKALLVSVLALLLAACGRPADPPGTVVLTYATAYPASHPFSRADIAWMNWIRAQSHGRIRIKPYWGGVLLSSNENVLEVRHGVADIGMITAMYTRSAHLQRVQPSFYSGIRSIPDQVDIYKCLATTYPAMSSDLRGLHLLAIQGGNFPGILTRNRPIRSLADLKGLRLRAQEDTAAVLKALGADPVNMSMAEVYPAMAKGVIDGVVAPLDALKSVHLADVGKYWSELQIPRGAYPSRAMADRMWNRLSPADQQIFDRAELVWEATMTSELTKALDQGRSYSRGEGIQFVPMPPADQARFDTMYRANTMRIAGNLRTYGIDGTAIATRAAQLVADRNAGRPLNCGDGR